MRNKNRIDVPFKLKAINETTGEFSGYGSVFGNEDSYGDVVKKGAFKESLKNGKPALLWQHRSFEPIGVWRGAKEDDNGLYMEGKLSTTRDEVIGVRQADEAYRLLKDGAINGLSIGYYLEPEDWYYDKEKNIFVLTKIDLQEVSLVTFPANDQALVVDVKSIVEAKNSDIPPERFAENALRDAGASKSEALQIIHAIKNGNQCDAEKHLKAVNQLTQIIEGK